MCLQSERWELKRCFGCLLHLHDVYNDSDLILEYLKKLSSLCEISTITLRNSLKFLNIINIEFHSLRDILESLPLSRHNKERSYTILTKLHKHYILIRLEVEALEFTKSSVYNH